VIMLDPRKTRLSPHKTALNSGMCMHEIESGVGGFAAVLAAIGRVGAGLSQWKYPCQWV
jgi:hypothetical protein